jgi:hypothetical protein
VNIVARYKPARWALDQARALYEQIGNIWIDLEAYEDPHRSGLLVLGKHGTYPKEGSRTSVGPSVGYIGLSMISALTISGRVQGGMRMPFPGGKRVETPRASFAASRAAVSFGARTTASPRCELASQFGSSGSTGINLQIGIIVTCRLLLARR